MQACRELVNRIVASNLIAKSTRLRDLFLYLCSKALDESIDDIHELELGYRVFGRPEHYDTAADNIVRVHASLLRKRLAEYFQVEGKNESLVVEIPKGNYAPVFRRRDLAVPEEKLIEPTESPVFRVPASAEPKEVPEQLASATSPSKDRSIAIWRAWSFAFLTVILAFFCALLLVRTKNQTGHGSSLQGAEVRQLWSGIFHQGSPTQIVLDDASLDFYQQVSGRQVSLTEYFDRSYLHSIEDAAGSWHLDPKAVQSFLLKRQSNFADVNLVGRLSQTSEVFGSGTTLYFARDFSFRQLKSGNNIVLLGTRQSNPWIQALDSYLALRWKYDPALDGYYPVDSTAKAQDEDKFRSTVEGAKSHAGYASVAFLPNVSGTGNILVISGTGGAAVGAALDFLKDESSVSQLRSRMGKTATNAFPYFEALLRTENGGNLPRSVTIVLSRSPRPLSSNAP